MGRASKRKQQRRKADQDFLSAWQRDSYICFIRDFELQGDLIILAP